ncbi:hypothetical protein NECAME_05279, partial [Necator americanus]
AQALNTHTPPAKKSTFPFTENSEQREPILPQRSTSATKQNRKSKMAKEDGLISNLRSYPPAVFLMLGNEFCERFSFYGMKAILTLYFIYEHGYTDRGICSYRLKTELDAELHVAIHLN